MKVSLQYALSDAKVPVGLGPQQRQLITTIALVPEETESQRPLNVGIVFDRSASVGSLAWGYLKQGLLHMAAQLTPQDRLTVVGFNHCAQVLVRGEEGTQPGDYWRQLRSRLEVLEPGGGTCLNEALRLGLMEMVPHRQGRVSEVVLITDGHNEHGSDRRCDKLAEFLAQHHLGFQCVGLPGGGGDQDYAATRFLTQLVNLAQGTWIPVEEPEQLPQVLGRCLTQLQTLRCTQTLLQFRADARLRLAAYQPWAQVSPEVSHLQPQSIAGEDHSIITLSLGTLVTYSPKVVLTNFYVDGCQSGVQTLAQMQVQGINPGLEVEEWEPVMGSQEAGHLHSPINTAISVDSAMVSPQEGSPVEEARPRSPVPPGEGEPRSHPLLVRSPTVAVRLWGVTDYQPSLNPHVRPHVLNLAKYRQIHLAEARLLQGDRQGAIPMLYAAALAAQELGNPQVAHWVGQWADRLRRGESLSPHDRHLLHVAAQSVI
jgi:Ca-activated chloride channel homolog